MTDGISSSTWTTVAGLSDGTSYVFRVAAVDGLGAGSWSHRSGYVWPETPTIEIDFVAVGDPGNAPDSSPAGFGAVADEYRIGKFEFTNAQYVAFLNAIDPQGTNPNGVYDQQMTTDGRGGIRFTASASAGVKYSTKANMADKPVNFVSWFDAARVANWLHNDARTHSVTDASANAPQNGGAYPLGTSVSGVAPVRNAGARFALPLDDEWYKAAYFKGGASPRYWDYATQSDTRPTPVTASATGVGSAGGSGNFENSASTADWNGVDGNVTTVGTNGGPSFYGTFDMQGNVDEWVDSQTPSMSRLLRGGSLFYSYSYSSDLAGGPHSATGQWSDTGFRLVSLGTVENFVSRALLPAPDGFAASIIGTTATLTWQAPVVPPGMSNVGYEIEYSVDGGVSWRIGDEIYGESVASFTVAGLSLGQSYSFRIATRSDVGTGAFSAPTAPVVASGTAPGAPTIGTPAASAGVVTLPWTVPANTGNHPITDYLVEVSSNAGSTWAPLVDAAGTTPSSTVRGLAQGVAHVFRVRATNLFGPGAYSATSSPITLASALPSAPSIQSATAGDGTVALAWTAGSDGGSVFTSFTVEQSKDGGQSWQASTLSATLGGASRSATVTGLTNGWTYSFRLKAITAVGASPVSAASQPVTPKLASTLQWTTDAAATVWSASAATTRTFAVTNGTREYRVGVRKGTDTSTQDFATVLVTPKAPWFITNAPSGQTATERVPATIQFGKFDGVDGDGTAGNGAMWSVDVRWWAGGVADRPATFTLNSDWKALTSARGTLSLSGVTFPDHGAATVEVTVTDNDGQTAVRTVPVTVAKGVAAVSISGVPTTAREGDTIALSASVSKQGFTAADFKSFAWTATRAGTAVASGSGLTFSFVAPEGGTYDVTFTAVDDNGDAKSATATVGVGSRTPGAAIVGPPLPLSSGTALTFTATANAALATDSIASYAWSVYRGANLFPLPTGTVTNGREFTFTPVDGPTAATGYDVRLVVTDDDGQTANPQWLFPVMNALPVFDAEEPISGLPVAPVAEGTVLELEANAVDPGATAAPTYTWLLRRPGWPDEERSGKTLSLAIDDDGVWDVTVTATDIFGASAVHTARIVAENVAPRITGLSATVPGGSVATKSILQGESLAIVATAADESPIDAAGLLWSFDVDDDGVWEVVDGPAPGFVSPAFIEAGERVVRVRVVDAAGARGEATLPVTVAIKPPVIELLTPADAGPPAGSGGGSAPSGLRPFGGLGALNSAPARTFHAVVGAPVTYTGTIADVDPETRRVGTATIERTDAQAATVTLPLVVAADGKFLLAYTFRDAGTYSLTIRAARAEGVAATPETVTVIVAPASAPSADVVAAVEDGVLVIRFTPRDTASHVAVATWTGSAYRVVADGTDIRGTFPAAGIGGIRVVGSTNDDRVEFLGEGSNPMPVGVDVDAAVELASIGVAVQSALGGITLRSPAKVGGTIRTTAAQRYLGSVILAASTTIEAGTGDVTFGGTVDGTKAGEQNLAVKTGGAIRFDRAVGGTVPLGSLGLSQARSAAFAGLVSIDGRPAAAGSDGIVIGSGVHAVDLRQPGSTVVGSRGAGLALSGGSKGSVFSGLTIKQTGGGGVSVSAGDYAGTRIEAVSVIGNAGAGVALLGAVDGITLGGPGKGIIAQANAHGIDLVDGPRNVVIDSGTFSGNYGNGVRITGTQTKGITVRDTLIGLVRKGDGFQSQGNATNGMIVTGAADVTVTGTSVTTNSRFGLLVNGGATRTTITGSFIGVAPDGTTSMGNGLGGIWVLGGATGTTLAASTIAANGGTGVQLTTSDGPQSTVVSGNTIRGNGAFGMSVSGNLAGSRIEGNSIAGNTNYGMYVNGAMGLVVGGTTAAAANVVEKNVQGIVIGGVLTGTTIAGNTIRANPSGGIVTIHARNLSIGIGNSISENSSYGIYMLGDSTGTVIRGNTIGGQSVGVWLNDATGVTIGSTTGTAPPESGASNAIVGNSAIGVYVDAPSRNIAVLSNAISGNAAAGLFVAEGTNAVPAPTSIAVGSASGAGRTVTGRLAAPRGTYRIQLFRTAAGRSGGGQGEELLGVVDVTIGSESAVFTFQGVGGILAGDLVTATATRIENGMVRSTSAFSVPVAG